MKFQNSKKKIDKAFKGKKKNQKGYSERVPKPTDIMQHQIEYAGEVPSEFEGENIVNLQVYENKRYFKHTRTRKVYLPHL